MAKKKLSDVLRDTFGSKLDEEIDLGEDNKVEKNESTKEEKTEPSKAIEGEKEKKEETSEKKEEEKVEDTTAEEKQDYNVSIFEEGWYDEASGVVDLLKIKNPEALAAIKMLTERYKAEKEARLIADGINDEMKNYSLNVSEDTVRKVLDTTGVKIDKDGNVVGVKEAFESLKNNEPTFFKSKEKESSPLNEGFDPVEKRSNEPVKSFSQAFRLMDELNNNN